MRVALFSDLHTEFDGAVPWTPPDLDADVIVFAGDNVTSPWQLRNFASAVEQRQRRTQHIIYVCGNHEFYGASTRFGPRGYEKYASALAECERSVLLEEAALEFNGVRFIAATMWTPVQDSVSLEFNDYRYIRIDKPPYRRLRPSDVRDRYAHNVRFLERHLQDSVPTIVVTHHPPSPVGLDIKHGDPWTAELDDVIERTRPLAWLHGHVHKSHDDQIGVTRVVSNPRGYFPDHLNRQFDARFVLTLDC